ncbi:MAG TPA: hypothetical protein PLR74_07800, partial [Agriterribacter sp.]|nr:hypothetical protein [Agriterribacter sp.]
GKRTIDITLACRLKDDYCNEPAVMPTPAARNCCEENIPGTPGTATIGTQEYPGFAAAPGFYNDIVAALHETYYYISEDLVVDAAKKGVGKVLENKLRSFLIRENKVCYCAEEIKQYDAVLKKAARDIFYNAALPAEKVILDELFKPRKALKVLFSGEKEWIEPAGVIAVTMSPALTAGTFLLHINATLTADQPAVTFYNKDELKEDFNTTLPLVKVELDDTIKLVFTESELEERIQNKGTADHCCLLKKPSAARHMVSLYHFFRNVIVLDKLSNDPPDATRIDVSVCGLKNFIVQNDESVQDVNGLVYPFGTRPVVDANFYIGSSELFGKNWQSIQVNHNWKDKPGISFEAYYTAYQHMFIDPDDLSNKTVEGIIKDNNYKASFAVLKDGVWYDNGAVICDDTGVNNDNLLFRSIHAGSSICPEAPAAFDFAFKLNRNDFALLPSYSSRPPCSDTKRLDAGTRNCFLRITLKCQDFQHSRYAFILSRQMMAFGRLPDDLVAGAYYRVNPANAIIVFNSIGALAGDLDLDITNLQAAASNTKTQTAQTITEAHGAGGTGAGSPVDVEAHQADNAAQTTVNRAQDVRNSFDELALNIPFLPFLTPSNRTKLEAVIPNEPWTPVIKNISIDYTATATIADVEMIHLYPFEGTYKPEKITLQPALFPVCCDEGNLFIGLKDLEPAANVNILFQLAEATADSESDSEEIRWYYLDNNQWKVLRKGFEVTDDATGGLTTSGIIKFALPENMTKDNTILPKGLHWIRASVPAGSKTVSETIGIYT